MTMPPGRARREPRPAPATPDDRDGRGAGTAGNGVQRFDGRANMAAGDFEVRAQPWWESDPNGRTVSWMHP